MCDTDIFQTCNIIIIFNKKIQNNDIENSFVPEMPPQKKE